MAVLSKPIVPLFCSHQNSWVKMDVNNPLFNGINSVTHMDYNGKSMGNLDDCSSSEIGVQSSPSEKRAHNDHKQSVTTTMFTSLNFNTWYKYVQIT